MRKINNWNSVQNDPLVNVLKFERIENFVREHLCIPMQQITGNEQTNGPKLFAT